MREASEWLYWLCAANPFSHAVELVRFALYERLNPLALGVCLGLTLVFAVAAVASFNPSTRRCAGPAEAGKLLLWYGFSSPT